MKQQMRRATSVREPAQKKNRKRARRRSSGSVIRWLVCFLPAGLVMMWHPSCRWRRFTKSVVTLSSLSLVAIIAVTAVTAVQRGMQPPGGVRLVSTNPEVEVYGPPIPADVKYSYVDEYTIQEAVVITPEPTEEPETAYYNDGGKYFHTENCRYVKTGTQSFYIPRLLGLGIKPCPVCDAATLAAEYMDTNN